MNIEKWGFAEKAIEEITNIEKIDSSKETERLSKIKEKLERLNELRKKVLEKEDTLHLQHIALLKERNLYLRKWRMIEKLGQENDWQDDTGLLQRIRLLIEEYQNN
jgi:hypothetical protein